jgi:hypothetical protein
VAALQAEAFRLLEGGNFPQARLIFESLFVLGHPSPLALLAEAVCLFTASEDVRGRKMVVLARAAVKEASLSDEEQTRFDNLAASVERFLSASTLWETA